MWFGYTLFSDYICVTKQSHNQGGGHKFSEFAFYYIVCTESIDFLPLPQKLWNCDLLKATTNGAQAEDGTRALWDRRPTL